ncbi:hypothetical protein BJ742DRAFT_770203 [Cladochytrium replicatum]|nr:hypothetical protein BJ742DRAFT_770203 [Cladochytrium replicatum]
MEDLNTQLALLLGGNAVFGDSSLVSQAVDEPLAFLNSMTSKGIFSSPYSELTSPFMGTSPLDSMTIPVEELSFETLHTPGLSLNSSGPSPDMPFTSSHSPVTGMYDILSFGVPARGGSPSLQLAQSLLGNAMSEGALMGTDAISANELAALTAHLLANAQSALPPPPVTPAPSADLSLASMLLNMVREKNFAEPAISFSLPITTPIPPKPEAVATEPPPPPAIDPITGLPIKVKKKVGRKKKIRPTDPEIIAAELARKRLKNTEAAKRSRQKRMQKVDSLEDRLKILEQERDSFEAKVAELEEIKARLEARVEELESNMSDTE